MKKLSIFLLNHIIQSHLEKQLFLSILIISLLFSLLLFINKWQKEKKIIWT